MHFQYRSTATFNRADDPLGEDLGHFMPHTNKICIQMLKKELAGDYTQSNRSISIHKYSIGARSGDRDDHGRTLMCCWLR